MTFMEAARFAYGRWAPAMVGILVVCGIALAADVGFVAWMWVHR